MADTALTQSNIRSKYPEEISLPDTQSAFGEISFDFYEHNPTHNDSRDFFIISFAPNENGLIDENVYLNGSSFIYTNPKEFEVHIVKLRKLIHEASMKQFQSALDLQLYILRQLPLQFTNVDLLDFQDLLAES